MKTILKLTLDHKAAQRKAGESHKLAIRQSPWTSGEEQENGRSRLERTSTVVTTTKGVAIFNGGHVVIDSVNETTYG